MAFLVKNFNRYVIWYTSATHDEEAAIHLYLDERYQATLRFYRDGATMPPNSVNSSGQVTIYFRSRRFSEVIDILREESPVTIYLDTQTLTAIIYTGHELVGEEESRLVRAS